MAARDPPHATLLAFIIVLLMFVPASSFAADDDQTLLLAVVVNNHPTNRIGEFVLRDGALLARREELSGLGFRIPESASATKEGLVALAGLHDFAFRIDQSTQTLYVTASDGILLPQMLNAGASPDAAYAVESGTGLTLNYDLFGTSADGRTSGNGLFDMRAFSPWGVLSSGLLAYANRYPVNNMGDSPVTRLDSTYVYSDPETMRRYRAGDFISGSLPWTRAVRLGGIQVTSDFSMRPDLITFPVPALDGSVAVPSTVDVLVNGTQVLSHQVDPGPFQVTQLPLVNGGGTVSTTVTNALGQQVTTEQPFYVSNDLLAPDLQTYSAEVGFVRRNWGYVSNDYGSLAGALTYRRGLSENLTIEAHSEGYPGLFMGGVGGVMNIADFAVANFAIAGSTGPGHAGLQVWAGIQRIAQPFSFGASALFASHGFTDIAALNGDPVPRLQVNANVGLTLGRYGSIGIAYTGVDHADGFARDGLTSLAPLPPSSPGPLFLQPDREAHIVFASYSVAIGNVSLFANGFHDFADQHSNGVSIGITIPLGSRTTASTSFQSQSGAQSYQAEVSQSATTVGEWGYRAFGAVDDPDHEFAQVTYKSPVAQVTAGVDQFGNQTTVQAEVNGAVSVVDGGVFLSNQIDDSFAVVDTNGVGGIKVQQENRYAGSTDSNGRLLVPDLRSFEINHLSIDPLDAPLDATVPYAAREVRPPDRSGVVVKFPVKTSNGALLLLTDTAGTPLPFGSVATLQSTGVKVPVGYDGEAYFVDLQAHNNVGVEMPDGRRCDLAFDYQHVAGKIPSIGPLACEVQP